MFKKYQFDPAIASAIGCSDKAFIVEYISWSIADKGKHKPPTNKYSECFFDGDWYMWDTHATWQERMPWLAERTIRKYMAELKEEGWIKTAYLSTDKIDRTLYYTLDLRK